MAGVVLLAAIAAVLVHRDFGITWDEGVQARYGEQALAYFGSGLRDQPLDNRGIMRFYGPLVEMIPALFYGENHDGAYEIRHLVCALLTLGAIPGVYWYARLMGLDQTGAVIAVLALLMMPRFVGHAFNNSKDMPLATATVWFMCTLSAIVTRRDFRWRRIMICAATGGLAMCARPGIFPVLIVFAMATALISLLAVGPSPRLLLRQAIEVRPLVKVAVALVLAWLVMVTPWPWSHGQPITGPLLAMTRAAHYPLDTNVLFAGHTFSSTDLPRHYLLTYVLITVPIPILILALLGAGAAVLRLVATPRSGETVVAAQALLWCVLPCAAFFVMRPHAYDGMRHFLFILPAIAGLAGLGAAALRRRSRGVWPRRLLTLALLVAVLLPIRDLVRLHPYQATYFNGLCGGLRGAAGQFETDYWVSSYREAMLWINDDVADQADHVVTVIVGGDPSLRPAASYYAAPNVRVRYVMDARDETVLPQDADYAILTSRFGYSEFYGESPIVHEIGRDGATFTVIRARKSDS